MANKWNAEKPENQQQKAKKYNKTGDWRASKISLFHASNKIMKAKISMPEHRRKAENKKLVSKKPALFIHVI